ncbi:hypothetical protein GTZ89_44555 [Streptomyces sp. SID8382]|nr:MULTISPECIES: hypothetical protein [unclassified Streptomyces]MYX62490.1 hypothetical protein [Streptomyces sp. SID8382]
MGDGLKAGVHVVENVVVALGEEGVALLARGEGEQVFDDLGAWCPRE